MPQQPQIKHKLVFLTVNCSFSHSSLALPLLHNACADFSEWEWYRYDMTNAEDVMSAVRNIASYSPDLLLTDLYLFNRVTALDVLHRYHALVPQCRIVAGGPECLGDGADALLSAYPWLDCVIRGEGEESLRDYLLHFDDLPRTLPHILPAEGNGVYNDWGTSAYPVTDPFFVTDKPFAQMETSRGCPMGCLYCTSGRTSTRYRTLEQVREELRLMVLKGVSELRLLDRTFNMPQTRGAALLRLFREEFPMLRFHLEIHPQFLNDELREELSKAVPGQLHIECGIQCLNPEVQKLMGRRSDSVEALSGLRFLCKQTAFETHADLLAGLPGQTREHIIADTGALMDTGVAEIQLEVLKVLPGTPMRQVGPEHGLRWSPDTPYDVMCSDTMTLEDIALTRDLSRLLDLTWNHEELHSATVVMHGECEDFVSRLLSHFHDAGGNASVLWDLKKRFLFLHSFCRKYHLGKSQRALGYQWLCAGFPPEQGPDVYSCKTSTVPAGAELIHGDRACLGERETRYWRFGDDEITYYLAYNRKYSFNRPAAIWTEKEN